MAIFLKKSRADILRQALYKVQSKTPINAIGAGSIARAYVEAVTDQIGDIYDIVDFNIAQSVISSASGRSLDLIGQLYGVQRKTVGQLIQTQRVLGSFYFYLDSTFSANIVIPKGTKVFSAGDNFTSQQLAYTTTEDVIIYQGRLKAWAAIVPTFDSSVFTAGINTIVQHNFLSPVGASVKCTNPKPIIGQVGYEDDDNFRARIIKSVRVTASGTAEAIRFAALSVSGVRDIKVFDSTFGLGSFEVIVVPESKDVDAMVAVQVNIAIDQVRPVGINLYLRSPAYLGVDMSVSLVIGAVPGLDAELIRRRAHVAVLRYLNTLLPGDTLIYNKLIQYIFDSSDIIKDVQILKFAPLGIEAMKKNYTPEKEEMLVPGNIIVTSV